MGLGRAHVVARREERAHAAEDDDPHVVVLLGRAEGVVELDQQAPVLGIAGVGPVEQDPDDLALLELLVPHVFVVRHWRVPLLCDLVDHHVYGRPRSRAPDRRGSTLYRRIAGPDGPRMASSPGSECRRPELQPVCGVPSSSRASCRGIHDVYRGGLRDTSPGPRPVAMWPVAAAMMTKPVGVDGRVGGAKRVLARPGRTRARRPRRHLAAEATFGLHARRPVADRPSAHGEFSGPVPDHTADGASPGVVWSRECGKRVEVPSWLAIGSNEGRPCIVLGQGRRPVGSRSRSSSSSSLIEQAARARDHPGIVVHRVLCTAAVMACWRHQARSS